MNIAHITGLAHMLEHEAFKGTTRIGTLNWHQERPLLDAQDEGESSSHPDQDDLSCQIINRIGAYFFLGDNML